jgi:DNA mismatch repair protein MSH4
MVKSFVQSIPALYEGLGGTKSDLLVMIRENCRSENINPTIQLIGEVINEDVTYQKTPLDLRNQRTYAVKVMRSLLPLCSLFQRIC